MNDDARPPLPLRIARALGVGPRGFFKRADAKRRPAQLLELYSMEGCSTCRRVRQTLTELDIDYVHRSCPRGDSESRRRLLERAGKVQVPYLVDPNHGVEMFESADIIRHLVSVYGGAS